jgi:pyruvate/2-oxoglutarate dehydrogenase complex dihydrolipoamide dehydrogenase (E3) component
VRKKRRRKGSDTVCSRSPWNVLRAQTLSETRGFLKALVDVNSDRVLGFTALAADGGEIMASVQMAMMAGVPYTALRDGIWSHPTLVEGLIPLFSSAPLQSDHADTVAAESACKEIVK